MMWRVVAVDIGATPSCSILKGGDMASSGRNFNQIMLVAKTPDEVSQAVLSGTAGVSGYTVTTAGTGSVILTRKYIPTWAVVVAIIGLLFFLLGLLALLFKETDVLSVTLVPEKGGTKVTVSGVASHEMLLRIGACLNAMPLLDADAPGQLPAPPSVPVASVAVDSKTCPACAEDVKLAAQVCKHCGHKFVDQPVPLSAES
jgi:hypothetical protein